MPDQPLNKIDIPVQMFIRVTKRDGEAGERAKLMARDMRGREYEFVYEDEEGRDCNLTVCNAEEEVHTKIT